MFFADFVPILTQKVTVRSPKKKLPSSDLYRKNVPINCLLRDLESRLGPDSILDYSSVFQLD